MPEKKRGGLSKYHLDWMWTVRCSTCTCCSDRVKTFPCSNAEELIGQHTAAFCPTKRHSPVKYRERYKICCPIFPKSKEK